MEERPDPRGALVRPYAVTGGRTEPVREVTLDAILVTTVRGWQEAQYSGRDRQLIAEMCNSRPLSLAEVSSYMRIPLGVARVLVADMVAQGLLALHAVDVDEGFMEKMNILERVLSGLRRL